MSNMYEADHLVIRLIHSVSWIWFSTQSIPTAWTTSWAGRWRTGSRAEEKLDRKIYRLRVTLLFKDDGRRANPAKISFKQQPIISSLH